ncbi:hypothetical protein HKD37_07G018361 [Glycine soja]
MHSGQLSVHPSIQNYIVNMKELIAQLDNGPSQFISSSNGSEGISYGQRVTLNRKSSPIRNEKSTHLINL